MIGPDTALKVYLCREAVDFRKGINGLSVLVQQQLRLDPFAAQVVVFRNRRCDALKVLYWERNGFCLWAEPGHPPINPPTVPLILSRRPQSHPRRHIRAGMAKTL